MGGRGQCQNKIFWITLTLQSAVLLFTLLYWIDTQAIQCIKHELSYLKFQFKDLGICYNLCCVLEH